MTDPSRSASGAGSACPDVDTLADYQAGVLDEQTAAEIAEAERIPRKFLEQILAQLKARDLVIGKRGPTGGYVLARGPAEISFAEVLRAIDGPLALAPCASQTAFRPCPDCRSIETCEIRPVLIAVRDATAARLEGTSLADALAGVLVPV